MVLNLCLWQVIKLNVLNVTWQTSSWGKQRTDELISIHLINVNDCVRSCKSKIYIFKGLVWTCDLHSLTISCTLIKYIYKHRSVINTKVRQFTVISKVKQFRKDKIWLYESSLSHMLRWFYKNTWQEHLLILNNYMLTAAWMNQQLS